MFTIMNYLNYYSLKVTKFHGSNTGKNIKNYKISNFKILKKRNI